MAYKLRPQIKISYGRMNSPIRIPINDLFINAPSSFLTNDFTSGVSALTVQNINNFAVNEILFIGKQGIENSEIIKTHASTAPTGSTVTLASATTQAHSNTDQVIIIPYDQVEISTATTLTGTKTVLTTISLDVETETKYYDNSVTNGYYFARFKNSITATYSDYSDGCPVGSYAINTARWIIDTALDEINKTTSELFTDEFGFKQITKCEMEVLREQKRWSWMQVYGAKTPCAVGGWKIAVPSDIDDTNTNKSTCNFCCGTDSNMIWVDKNEFDNITQGVSWTTLASTLNIGDSTLTLTDSSNFASSGSILIGAVNLTYTANAQSTGVLTLSSNSTVTYSAGQDVFQNATQGMPVYFTVHSGYIWHYPVCDSLHDKMDYGLDYYSSLIPITSDTDTIIVPDPVLVGDYLRWKFIKRMHNGQEDEGSLEAKQCFIDRKNKLVQKEVMNKKIKLTPRYNDYSTMMQIDGDSKYNRMQGFVPNL